MKRAVPWLITLSLLVPVALVAAMVATVPDSAYVVPQVHVATSGEPVKFTPAELGARRTASGLEVDEARLDAAVDRLAGMWGTPAQPGTYELVDGRVVLRPGLPGKELDRTAAKTMLMKALKGEAKDLKLKFADVAAPPPPPNAVVVKLSEFRLELYAGTSLVRHFTVGVGALRFPTPPGVYHVRSKAKNPTWRNPGSRWARSMPSYIPPGPRNPLGTRALRLDREAIVIHGTPYPATVGRRSSHGCIRMRKADVEALFEMVPVNTPVFIVP